MVYLALDLSSMFGLLFVLGELSNQSVDFLFENAFLFEQFVDRVLKFLCISKIIRT